MIQPIGTVTYKGLRKSEAGEESLIQEEFETKDKTGKTIKVKGSDILSKSEKFHADGKAEEAKAKKKKTEAAEPAKKAPAVSAEGSGK